MNNNCTCRRTREKFLVVFQELKPQHWQLIESYGWVSKKGVSSRDDNIAKLDQATLCNGIFVSSEYAGCPYCKAMGIFICGHCIAVNCHDSDTGSITCAECHTDGELTPIDELGSEGNSPRSEK